MAETLQNHRLIARGTLAALALASVLLLNTAPTFAQTSSNSVGVTTLTGTVTVTNPNELADESEPIMLLIDLTAFIKRDRTMALAYPDDVVSAGLDGDLTKGAKFTMLLPIAPRAVLNNLSHPQNKNTGVMVFAVDFDFNDGSVNSIKNGPSIPSKWQGWPGGLDSLAFDANGEITDGELVVWAPDGNEVFPTGFGSDGKLFTADDPLGPIPQGWTVVKLHKDQAFEQLRSATVDVPIIEGAGALTDYSKLSYTAAFDKLIADLRLRYVYTDLKHIDWDELIKEIRPLVVKAETDANKTEYHSALQQLAAKFPDGHVSVTFSQSDFLKDAAGGLGLVLHQTDDGPVIATNVLANLPSAKAGIQVGAQITIWNGQPIDAALSATPLIFERASSPTTIRLLELEFITRSPVNTAVHITYQNPGAVQPQAATLTSVFETKSLTLASLYAGYDQTMLPITSQTLPNGIGYIKINSFKTDVVMFAHMWDYIFHQYTVGKVRAIIIDVRQNPGGYFQLADYVASSFVSDPFTLNQTYHADQSGKVVKTGESKITPGTQQWTNPVAILVSPACASACEIFASIIAHDPAHLIVGHYATAGIEGGVRPWAMPDGLTFNATVVRFQNPDGSVFLEGTGVQPTLKVPVTVNSLLSTNDDVLAAAEKALVP
jgi:C-terminal processing protease CtpA/Prc